MELVGGSAELADDRPLGPFGASLRRGPPALLPASGPYAGIRHAEANPRMDGPAATQKVTEDVQAFALTEDQQLFRREWRRLFEDKFTERAAEIDRTGEFPWDNLKVLAEAGLTGINVPEAYGGAACSRMRDPASHAPALGRRSDRRL